MTAARHDRVPPGSAPRDPELPALAQLTDRVRLTRLLGHLDWLREPDYERAVLRLRWKPGTSLQLGIVLPTATGPAAVLLVTFGSDAQHKAAALAERAAYRGAPVHREGDVVIVPAGVDPDLDHVVGCGALLSYPPLSYNPARRWVGRDGKRVIKVHAEPLPAGVAGLLTEPPLRLGQHLPKTKVRRAGRMIRTEWIAGTPPGVADLPAVWEALTALHSTQPPAGLPVLDSGAALTAAQAAGRSVVSALPDERERVATLLGVLRRACAAGGWPAPITLVHGDFSTDQVVVRGGHATLLDLDRAGVGPAGWDGAQWLVAQHAAGAPILPTPTPAPAVLVLAAALLRAPEPFRRLRTAWPRLTRDVLNAADDAAREITP